VAELDAEGRVIHETSTWDNGHRHVERWIEYEVDGYKNWTSKKTFESDSPDTPRHLIRAETRVVTNY